MYLSRLFVEDGLMPAVALLGVRASESSQSSCPNQLRAALRLVTDARPCLLSSFWLGWGEYTGRLK